MLEAAAEICGLDIAFRHVDVGEEAFRACGEYMSAGTIRACDEGQAGGNAAILFGAVPSEPIGTLRERYDLYANLRPVSADPSLSAISPLKPGVIDQVDMLIVRELTADVYYGKVRRGRGPDGVGEWASQEMYYNESILSAAMLCEHALGRPDARNLIENAVRAAVRTCRTQDIATATAFASTSDLGKVVSEQLYASRP